MMIAKQINTNQVAALMGVSAQTVWNWRKGTKTMAALPTGKAPKGSKHSVVFNVTAVLAWAKKNKLILATTIDKVAGESPEQAPSKSGPKPRDVVTQAPKKIVVAAKKPAASVSLGNTKVIKTAATKVSQ